MWVIDSANIELLTLSDTLCEAVALLSPDDEAPGAGTISAGEVKGIKLDWEVLDGATSYTWHLDDDSDFSDVFLEGDTDASYVNLPALDMATTYYWRVRAAAPALSLWSPKWSFTTVLGEEAIAPKLLYPEAGATDVPLRPILQWNSFAGASNYELVVSTDPAIGNPTILKSGEYALRGTAWQCNVNLNPGTAYYWKVRAVNGKTYSAWSSTGAFVTAAATQQTAPPTPTPAFIPTTPPAAPPAPAVSSSTDMPDWMVYLVGGLMLIIILLLVTVLVLVIVLKR